MLCDFLKTGDNNYYRSIGIFAFQDCKKKNPFIAQYYHEKTQWILDELVKLGIDPNQFVCIFENAQIFIPKKDWVSFCKVIVFNVCRVARIIAEKNDMQEKLDDEFMKFEEFSKSLNMKNVIMFDYERLINGNIQQ